MKIIAFVFLLFAMTLFSQKKETKLVDSVGYYIKQANFNTNRLYYKNGLINAQKAIDFSEKKNNPENKSKANATIGYIYFKLHKYNEAILSLKKSIKYFVPKKSLSEKASVYYLLGLCLMEIKNAKEAEYFFDKADVIYINANNSSAREMLNVQKGIVYKTKGNPELARAYFENILVNSEDEDDEFQVKSEALYQIGTIEYGLDRNSLALNYLNRALKVNLKRSNPEQKSRILHALSLVSEKLGDKTKSFNYLKNHLKIKDSIYNDINFKIEEDEYNQFKEIQQFKELNFRKRELEEKEKNSKFSKLISILAIALISILSLLSLSLYKNNIIRNRTNELLKQKNQELFEAKDKAEKAMQARSDFLSTVSHELRTPLNAITGITHLLIEENPKESQIEYLKSLKFSGNYLLTFINEILEANRIESNKIAVEYLNFNLKELIDNIKISLTEIALTNKNKINVEIDPEIPNVLNGDPTKIAQILINLINNGLKFTKNGTISINLKTESDDLETYKIKFLISDTGIGIPDNQIESIFESFSQGSIEINRTYGGTGLGLTIVKNLVEILGGKIQVESKVGQGSVFWFVIKFNKTKNELINIETKPIDLHKLEGKKILLVEDNKINQMITKKMLENKKVLCDIVDSGEDSIEFVKKNKYDLILMDVHLPGINGTTATEKIRKFNTKIPIIALTAISLDENRDSLLAFGMNDVLTKPFDPEEFYKIIAKYI